MNMVFYICCVCLMLFYQCFVFSIYANLFLHILFISVNMLNEIIFLISFSKGLLLVYINTSYFLFLFCTLRFYWICSQGDFPLCVGVEQLGFSTEEPVVMELIDFFLLFCISFICLIFLIALIQSSMLCGNYGASQDPFVLFPILECCILPVFIFVFYRYSFLLNILTLFLST